MRAAASVGHLHRGRPVGKLLGEAGAQQIQQPGCRRQDLSSKWYSQAQALLLKESQAYSGKSMLPVCPLSVADIHCDCAPPESALLKSGWCKARPADSCTGTFESCCARAVACSSSASPGVTCWQAAPGARRRMRR